MSSVVQATPAALLDSLIRRYLKDDLAVREYVPFVLNAITHHRLLHDHHDQTVPDGQKQSTQHRIWTQRVRALLESQQPGARWAGVCFVRITAQQSPSMFTENVRTWVTLLVGMLTKQESTAALEAVITTLSELFAKTAKRADLKSDVASKHLPDFCNHILNHKDKKELLPTIFRALTQSVTLFPTTFRLTVDKAEALCVAYMDGRFDVEPELVNAAGTCFVALHWAGGKNPNHPTERISPSEQWRTNMNELIKAMHRCLNVLFSTLDEDMMDESDIAGKNKYLTNMPAPDKDVVQRYPQMFSRFSSLSKVLIASLTCSTKEPVHLPLNSLVALLSRVYNVSTKSPMSDARGVDPQEYYTLISGLSSLHLASNEVLKTLLATAQDHLVRHMSHLATIAVRLIRNTSGESMSTILRISTYSIVETCIQAFGIPFVNMIQVPLMNALLDDLRMPTAKIVNPLEIGAAGSNPNSRANNHTNTTKHKGGAGKNRRGHQSAGAAGSPAGGEDIVNPQVFIAASNILSLALTTAGPNLAPHARAAADTLVITHLLNSQYHVNPIEPVSSEAAFYTAPVRIQLYKTLMASISSPGEAQSNLVPLSVGVFKTGLSDSEKYVRDSCTMALNVCDLIMHSRMPPMQRARTSYIAQKAGKGEKAVQEAGSTLFGDFEVSESAVKHSGKDKDESESESENEEEDDDDQDEQDKDSDVDMEDGGAGSDLPSTLVAESKAAVGVTKQPAAAPAPEQARRSRATTTISSRKEEYEQDKTDTSSGSMNFETTKTITSTSKSSSTTSTTERTVKESLSSLVKMAKTTTTAQVSHTVSAAVMTSTAIEETVGSNGDGGDDDDFVIPAIVMEDDDDEDMDSD
ncbi:Proline-, glutamic acid- and leucine-rich protein 1 [Mortierella sp. GBA43]|nr:Proline-, glutamic acid- and leucine-rich protein 1 [Mortierella sp. GBA43]